MLTKEKAIEVAEKRLSSKLDPFKKAFFVLESITDGTWYKHEGKNKWSLFDYHANWIEFTDNTEKHHERNTLHAKINASSGKTYEINLKLKKSKNKKPSKTLIKQMNSAKKILLTFLKKEYNVKDIQLPLSIEKHPIHKKVFYFKNKIGQFYVSLDGFITDCWFSISDLKDREFVSEKKCIEKIKSFLDSYYPNFSKRNFELKSFFDDERVNTEFDLIERPRKGEFSIYQNHIKILLNRRKNVIESYHASNLWERKTKSPKITAENAVKIFTKKFKKAESIQIQAHEKLFEDKFVTIWYIHDENYRKGKSIGAWMEINGNNGKIIREGVFE